MSRVVRRHSERLGRELAAGHGGKLSGTSGSLLGSLMLPPRCRSRHDGKAHLIDGVRPILAAAGWGGLG